MKVVLGKEDLAWLQKNGFIGPENVGPIWDQLTQKCTLVTDDGTVSNESQKRNVSLPEVEGTYLEQPKLHDICIAFSLVNGENLAKSLQKQILWKNKNVILANSTGVFNPQEIERNVARSSSLVVLLTADSLKQPEVVFALHVAKYYYQNPSLVILVHDAEGCFFPGADEQPSSANEFFSEKAVTYLSCYPEEAVLEILSKYQNELSVLHNMLDNFRQNPTEALYQLLESRKQFKVSELRTRMKPFMSEQQLTEFETFADKNKDGMIHQSEIRDLLNQLKSTVKPKTENEHPTEDLTTRIFLSHKRSTGQGIAGRLYEGLKSHYSVFIDSEAKFKIHNLKLIVQNTDVFVFILSHGILLSKWCLEELKSAIENKKQIIVVRELSYKLPETFPSDWLSVEPVLRNSAELVWIAEYNTACVKALTNMIGSPDARRRPAQLYFATEQGKQTFQCILDKFNSDKILDIGHTISLPQEVTADAVLDFVLQSIHAAEIRKAFIGFSAGEEREIRAVFTSTFSRLPQLEEAHLFGIYQGALQELLYMCPHLLSIELDGTSLILLAATSRQDAAPQFKSFSISKFSLGSFKELVDVLPTDIVEAELCFDIDNDGAECFASKFPKLKSVTIESNSIQEKGIISFCHPNNTLTALSIDNCKLIQKSTIEKVGQACKSITNLQITRNQQISEDIIPVLTREFPNLKTLTADIPITRASKFADFKTARPQVAVLDPPYLKDVKVKDRGVWYPGILVFGSKGTKKHSNYHLYGFGRGVMVNENDSAAVAPVLTNSDNYGEQNNECVNSDCDLCALLHPLCEHTKFAGNSNIFFTNHWFFETEAGKEFASKYVPQDSGTEINFQRQMPGAIQPWGVVRKLSTMLDCNKTYTLNFFDAWKNKSFGLEIPYRFILQVLDQALPIGGLQFNKGCKLEDSFFQDVSTKVPNLSRLVIQYTGKFTEDGLNKMNLPELRYLDLSGCEKLTDSSINGLARSSKLTDLILVGTKLSDDAIAKLAPHWKNLVSLNLRGNLITERGIQFVLNHCPLLEKLNIALIKVSPSILKILADSLPKLKEITVPYSFSDTQELAAFKCSRPDVTVLEKTEFVDSEGLPAVLLGETADKKLVHQYGQKSNSWVSASSVAPLMENKDKYQRLDENHCAFPCSLCEFLHPYCRNLEFGSSRNLFFKDDWYFETPEGKELVKSILDALEKDGNLNDTALTGVTMDKFLSLQVVKPEQIKTLELNRVISLENYLQLLHNASNIQYLFLLADFSDAYLTPVNLSGLKGLHLFRCDITDEALQSVADRVQNLTTFGVQACSKISDKGVSCILKANTSLTNVELDFSYQLSTQTIELLGSLPNISSIVFNCKPNQKDIIAAVEQIKSKRDVSITRSPSMVDSYFSTDGRWHPAIILDINETTNQYLVHFYGQDHSSQAWVSANEADGLVAPPYTHAGNYGEVSMKHLRYTPCRHCAVMKILCLGFSFPKGY